MTAIAKTNEKMNRFFDLIIVLSESSRGIEELNDLFEFTEYIGFGPQVQRAKKRADASTRFSDFSLLNLFRLSQFSGFGREKTPWVDRPFTKPQLVMKMRTCRAPG